MCEVELSFVSVKLHLRLSSEVLKSTEIPWFVVLKIQSYPGLFTLHIPHCFGQTYLHSPKFAFFSRKDALMIPGHIDGGAIQRSEMRRSVDVSLQAIYIYILAIVDMVYFHHQTCKKKVLDSFRSS